mmetsp:Transcript_8981/g.13497  ORF Transcript_8981/g.13497 Transcript_8981/m.13497 type:complete len:138 (+) Transcript_8981:71-484(+)|eukprot:CAMPEP_0185023258 /NCGR_PEP_ID=MMETSP1103-20130426/5940_1 /TAXON_ID=36769 /ORGANISM="Paraphysomonas bandaiensis, Strain Caron Lab Isolate" /LENGTH=137 /DNA_ID=CAMNT_0027555759 /DNA_START=58 /DNA_END=471 /DNA_ORIENTATION=-
MSADTLTLTSRAFYERAKAKLATSIVLGAGALMLLGFCSSNSGLSSFNDTIKDQQNDDELEEAYGALAGGYGFASFCHILGFVLLLAAAIFVSPLICGSNNEKKIVNNPQELDSTYSAYSEGGSKASAPPASQSSQV